MRPRPFLLLIAGIALALMAAGEADAEVSHSPAEVDEGDTFLAWIDADEIYEDVKFYVCTLEAPYTCYQPQKVAREDAESNGDGTYRYSFSYQVGDGIYPGYRYELIEGDNQTKAPAEGESYPGLTIEEMQDSYYFKVERKAAPPAAAIIDFISSDDACGLVNLTEKYDNTTTITTYFEGKKTGYISNGNYGDVITYYKNGLTTYEGNSITPVTSRVMAWVEVRENGSNYYLPGIDMEFTNGKLVLAEIGLPPGASLTGLEHSGYITKKDENLHPEQLTHRDVTGIQVQPVQPEWIVGIYQQFVCRMGAGSNVIFEGHALGSSTITITEYLWESSIDGELSTNASFSTSSLSEGNHTILFRVRDDSGLWSFPAYASLWIYHVYKFPIAITGDDGTVKSGDTVQFNGAGTDEDGEIVLYEWDFNNDGVYEWSSDENGRITNIYNNEGTHTAVLRVTDNDGFTATDSRIITVSKAGDGGEGDDGGGDDDGGGIPALSLAASVAAVAVIALRRRR